MKNYLDLIRQVLDEGVDRPDRTGIGSRFVNGATLRWDLSKGFPALTTRRVPFRFAFEETMFFLRGETDTTLLEEKDINIWKGNTSREFLDKHNLHHLPVGSIGTGYSHQWRNFGGTVGELDGVDQVRNMLDDMRNNPTSRRHLISAWNPSQLEGTPLPPCHLMHMYTIADGKLNSSFIMRSNDIPFGLPFNIMSYALLNCVFAKYLGLEPGELVYFGWDAHIYQNQIEMCEEQIKRKPMDLPILKIHRSLDTFEDMLNLEYGTDVELLCYDPLPDLKNKPPMAV